jgi:serine/threonine protein kinase
VRSDRSRHYDGANADVWSAGVMLYTLATGLRPFVEAESDTAATIMSRMADARYLQHTTFAESRLQGTSSELRALMRAMLEQDPAARVTMRQVWPQRRRHRLHLRARHAAATHVPCLPRALRLPCTPRRAWHL